MPRDQGVPNLSPRTVADTGLSVDSKAQAEQIRSVAVERIGPRVGALRAAASLALDEAIRVHLAL